VLLHQRPKLRTSNKGSFQKFSLPQVEEPIRLPSFVSSSSLFQHGLFACYYSESPTQRGHISAPGQLAPPLSSPPRPTVAAHSRPNHIEPGPSRQTSFSYILYSSIRTSRPRPGHFPAALLLARPVDARTLLWTRTWRTSGGRLPTCRPRRRSQQPFRPWTVGSRA
jgi:hypothetical protein